MNTVTINQWHTNGTYGEPIAGGRHTGDRHTNAGPPTDDQLSVDTHADQNVAHPGQCALDALAANQNQNN